MTEVEEQKEKDIFQLLGRMQQPSQLEMSVPHPRKLISQNYEILATVQPDGRSQKTPQPWRDPKPHSPATRV